MPIVTNNKIDDPCQECRNRHLKCDDNLPKCKNCEKLSSSKCIRSGGKLKFRHGSSAKYDTIFEKDQTWLSQSRNAKIQFVDQGPELENFYSHDDADSFKDAARYSDASVDLDGATLKRVDTTSTIKTSPTPHHFSPVERSKTTSDLNLLSPTSTVDSFRSSLKRPPPEDSPLSASQRRVDQWQSTVYDPVRSYYVLPQQPKAPTYYNGVAVLNEHNDVPTLVEAEYRRLADTQAAAIPAEHLLTPDVWKREFYWPNAFTTTQCACLMSYFIEQLAPWFDVGDPERTFALIVPQRARRCPPLLNAIFTAAARHLVSISRYQGRSGVIVYRGTPLPNLKLDTAIHYHQACIAYLKKLGQDEVSIQDENLLAAAIILRYYEEFDYGLTGEDAGPLFATFNLFVNAQANHIKSYPNSLVGASPATSPDLWSPPNTNSSSAAHSRPHILPPSAHSRQQAISQLKTFRHACFRVALRQETTTSFMKQRPIPTSLPSTWSLLSLFEPHFPSRDDPDFIHSDRHLLHCARVLQYCFGSSSPSSPTPTLNSNSQSSLERYQELKAHQLTWENTKPLSFSPIHYASSVSTQSSFTLPSIWYISEIHGLGLSYLSLASILLTVYDPSLPRLGPNLLKERKRVAREVREIVVRLCGVAMSFLESQSAKIQAYVAIIVCGEYFGDVGRKEQEALWVVVEGLEVEWGWPTGKARHDLRQAWGWD